MRTIVALIMLTGPTPPTPLPEGRGEQSPPPFREGGWGGGCFAGAEYPALKQRLQRGNYAEALVGYEELAESEKAVAAFAGQAACHRALGDTTKAFDALDAGLKASPDNPDLLARRADLFYTLGRWDDATKDAEAAIKKQADHFLARWVRAGFCATRATSRGPTPRCGGS